MTSELRWFRADYNPILDERYKELAEEWGYEKGLSILSLWNVYDLYIGKQWPVFHSTLEVDRACSDIHALWVGANCRNLEKSKIFVHYDDLDSKTKYFDMVDLVNCWKRLERPINDPMWTYIRANEWDEGPFNDS